jgi:hypothetical protein
MQRGRNAAARYRGGGKESAAFCMTEWGSYGERREKDTKKVCEMDRQADDGAGQYF